MQLFILHMLGTHWAAKANDRLDDIYWCISQTIKTSGLHVNCQMTQHLTTHYCRHFQKHVYLLVKEKYRSLQKRVRAQV